MNYINSNGIFIILRFKDEVMQARSMVNEESINNEKAGEARINRI